MPESTPRPIYPEAGTSPGAAAAGAGFTATTGSATSSWVALKVGGSPLAERTRIYVSPTDGDVYVSPRNGETIGLRVYMGARESLDAHEGRAGYVKRVGGSDVAFEVVELAEGAGR